MRFLHETQRGAPLDFSSPKWKVVGDAHYCTNKTRSEFGQSERQDFVSEYRLVAYIAPNFNWQSCYQHLADDIAQGVYEDCHVESTKYEVNDSDEAVVTVVVCVA